MLPWTWLSVRVTLEPLTTRMPSKLALRTSKPETTTLETPALGAPERPSMKMPLGRLVASMTVWVPGTATSETDWVMVTASL